MEEKTKKGIFMFILMVLLLPVLQQYVPFIKSGALYGHYSHAPDVGFSWHKWFDGTYQKGKTEFYNDNTGFRPDMLRLNNQIDFTLFDKVHGKWALLGRDNYLYQYQYIDTYYGEDFVGYPAIRERAYMLKAVQDTLACLGKSLVLVYAPGKADFYPEYFPESRSHEKKGITNFEVYRHMCDSLRINQVDLSTWFLSLKSTSKELLFSKQGIHWTVYGSLLAGDSLVRYIENLRHIEMPHPVWQEAVHTSKPRDPDDDIAKEQNLIFPIANETFCYPEVQYHTDTTQKRPKAIYIGDSFGLGLIKNGMIQNEHTDWEYWYYFSRVYNGEHPDEDKPLANIENYDWKGALGKTDCAIILYTTYTLSQLGHGFIEQAYHYYYPNGRQEANQKLTEKPTTLRKNGI